MDISYNKKRKFDEKLFDDCNIISDDEQIFSDNPIYTFQVKCLEPTLQLCGWSKRNLAHLLKISDSTVNNILANDSMTNDKPTYLNRSQFISLLYIIQTKKVKLEKKSLVVFFLFSWLCAGLPAEMNFDKYEQLLSLESSELDKTLFYKVLNNLCPRLLHSFNLYMEWRFKGPELSMSEFFGGEKNENFSASWFSNQPKDTEENAVKKAIRNIHSFLPTYLEWYVSQFTKWD
ncbi:MAG: hypothetical protein J6K96_02825 [Treponema sp.]|nr:hypothetical protein [Treponema sp.]